MKCIACTHWQPRNAPKGMFAQGLAPCAIRSTSSCGPAAVATIVSAYGQEWTREGLEKECNLSSARRSPGVQAGGSGHRAPHQETTYAA